MAHLTLREAARLFDVSRPTLTKALNSGKISGHRDEQGRWTIDQAELLRVYHPRRRDPAGKQVKSGKGLEEFSTANSQLTSELAALREELFQERQRRVQAEAAAEAAERIAEEREKHLEDLRRLLPLVAEQRSRSEISIRSLWKRVVGQRGD
jgi:excisionase family DNA binding protein